MRQPGARGWLVRRRSQQDRPVLDRELYAAFADSELRRSWLPDLELTERTARPGRSISFDAADGSRVSAEFAASGAGKAQVAASVGSPRDLGARLVRWRLVRTPLGCCSGPAG
jgi:hypothetical protein